MLLSGAHGIVLWGLLLSRPPSSRGGAPQTAHLRIFPPPAKVSTPFFAGRCSSEMLSPEAREWGALSRPPSSRGGAPQYRRCRLYSHLSPGLDPLLRGAVLLSQGCSRCDVCHIVSRPPSSRGGAPQVDGIINNAGLSTSRPPSSRGGAPQDGGAFPVAQTVRVSTPFFAGRCSSDPVDHSAKLFTIKSRPPSSRGGAPQWLPSTLCPPGRRRLDPLLRGAVLLRSSPSRCSPSGRTSLDPLLRGAVLLRASYHWSHAASLPSKASADNDRPPTLQ